MHREAAFEGARQAFHELCVDTKWRRSEAKRDCGRLDTFVELRTAVWVEAGDLAAARADVPKLNSLAGIRSTVYGVRFAPGPNPTLATYPFLCYCPACHRLSANADAAAASVSSEVSEMCSFEGLCAPLGKHTFQVNRVRSITKAQLAGYLYLHAPRLSRSGNKAALVTRVANIMSWDTEERPSDPDELSQAVSRRLVAFTTAWLAERDRAAQELDVAVHEARVEAAESAEASLAAKPFVCPACGKCFSDQKYLARHERSHASDSDAVTTAPARKKRKVSMVPVFCWCKQETGDDFVSCAVGRSCNGWVHKGCDGISGRAPSGLYSCRGCRAEVP